jgi:hypothetical protein
MGTDSTFEYPLCYFCHHLTRLLHVKVGVLRAGSRRAQLQLQLHCAVAPTSVAGGERVPAMSKN